jgi:hypothetical protein
MPPAVHPYSSSRQRLRHSLIGGSKRRLKSLEGFVSKGSETATSFTVKLPGKASSDMRPGPSAGRGRPPGADSMRPWCRPGPRYSAEINHIDMCCISRPALPLFLPCEAIRAGAFFPSSVPSESHKMAVAACPGSGDCWKPRDNGPGLILGTENVRQIASSPACHASAPVSNAAL